jgi:hypothetical protein
MTVGHQTCINGVDPSGRVKKLVQVLAHTSKCQEETCSVQCSRMKRIVLHFSRCRNCSACRQFFSIVYFHAKSCKSSNCKVSLDELNLESICFRFIFALLRNDVLQGYWSPRKKFKSALVDRY